MHDEYIKRPMRSENVHSVNYEYSRMGFMEYEIKRLREQVQKYDKIWMPRAWGTEHGLVYGYVIAKHKNFFVLEMGTGDYKEAFLWFDLAQNLHRQKQKEGKEE